MPERLLKKRSVAAAAVLGIVTALLVAVAAAATSINPANAPTGTHVQTGTPSCSVDPNTLLVTCSSYELAGVGNTNASATLDATYTATVQCRNHGGQIVDVKSQAEATPTTTG